MRLHLIQILILFACFPVIGQDVYRLKESIEPIRISKNFVYLEDTTNQFDIHSISSSGHFKKIDQDVPNFNITTSTIWARINFIGDQTKDWYLSLDPASFNSVTLYQRKGRNGKWIETKSGYNSNSTSFSLAANHFMFKLDVSATDTTLVLFRVNDYFPITLDFKVAPLSQYVSGYHNNDLYNGICFGVMIMMMIYNLYLYLTNRSMIYIYYVLYVLFSILFTGYLAGYGIHFPDWVNSLNYKIPIIPPAMFGVFGMLFTLELFKDNLSRGFKRRIYFFMSLALGDIILSATPYKHLSEKVIQFLGLFLSIISIAAGIIALRKKNSSAIYYLFGFGAYMSSLFYLILSAQGLFTITGFTWQCLLTGSMLESIFLSFALGDKFKLAQVEREKAQLESLERARENERLIKEQNTTLEKKVRERTLELQEQKEIVEQKNKEIVDSINYAKRIQNVLMPSEKNIEKNLNRLKKD